MGSLPVMMKPPIITLAPVPTCSRVEMFASVADPGVGVGVGVTLGVGLGSGVPVAVGVGLAGGPLLKFTCPPLLSVKAPRRIEGPEPGVILSRYKGALGGPSFQGFQV